MKRWLRDVITVAAAWVVVLGPQAALAASLGDPSSSSTNYRIDESTVGGSGDYESASGSYKTLGGIDGGATLGDTAVGNSSSANFQVNSGTNTSPNPALTFIVNTANVNLGVLSMNSANTATATFSVINYTSYGYNVTLAGPPPSYQGRQLTALASDTASQNGVEQFGVNVVANTSPVSVGSDPLQDISNGTTFGFGRAGAGSGSPYAQTGKYRYVNGDSNPIASANKSSGKTTYTMSFMANMSNGTPSGAYTGSMTLICTGSY